MSSLQEGNIFICDYKRLEGVPTRVVNGKPLPLTAALCLFYKNPEDNLTPIAIQVHTPAPMAYLSDIDIRVKW